MKALIKINDTTDIIAEPFPTWLDAVAFSVFDCYGYALCEDFTPSEAESSYEFLFSINEIENPYKQSDDDPDTIIQHIATQI